MPRGTPIFAKESGVVVEAGANEYFRPKPVYIQEDDGDIAIYGHLWDNTVKRGDHVAAGQKIGISGEQTIPGTMTPDGSGPHIHFELRRPVLDDKGRPTGSYKAIDPKDELLGATGATFLSSRTGQGQLMGFSLDPDSTTGKIVMGIILVSVTLGALIYAASA
jgi:murein DD-endopeptidase MepM/ murein hydrolase activator NlpD